MLCKDKFGKDSGCCFLCPKMIFMKKYLHVVLMLIPLVIVTAQKPIQCFTFDGNLLNSTLDIAFTGTSSYVVDRFGVPNKAIRLENSHLEAVMSNLPQNNAARTVAVWVKFNDVASANYLWGYGTPYNSQYFGLIHQAVFNATSNLSLAGWGASNDLIAKVDLSTKNWIHYVVTCDGKTSYIYRNGELIVKGDLPERLTKGKVFRLGKIDTVVGINVDIDDLKIYDLALSQEQVASLYSNERIVMPIKVAVVQKKMDASTKTLKAEIKTENELENAKSKGIEIYSQGNKVLGSNQPILNVNDLPEGTYLLKVINMASKNGSSKG